MSKQLCTENLTVRLIETALDQQLINDEDNTTKIYVTTLDEINYYIESTLKEIRSYTGVVTFISQVSDVEMFVPPKTEEYDDLNTIIEEALKDFHEMKEKVDNNIERLEGTETERILSYTAQVYKQLATSDWMLGPKKGTNTKLDFARIIAQIISSREKDIGREISETEMEGLCNLIASKSKHYEYNVNTNLSETLDNHVSGMEQDKIMSEIVNFLGENLK